MTDTNLSAVLVQKGDIQMKDRPIPEPGPGEVQIAVHSVGICGSDVHYWVHGYIGDFVVKNPMVLGHESSGTVTKLGTGVTNLKVGDRVALEPGIPCRVCEFCKKGRYNLCLEVQFLATPPVDGDLCRYHVHAADFCFKLPDNVSFEEGALLEPLSVGVHACRRGQVTAGDNVLICGAGPIGLVNLLTAKAMGAAKVCVTDIAAHRLEVAKQMGADLTILVETKDSKALAKKVIDTMGSMPDCTIECSGAESSTVTGMLATKSGGVLVVVGMGPPEMKVPLLMSGVRELDIRGVFRYANCYPIALNLIASGAVNVTPLVTHHFSLEQTLQAFEVAKTGTGNAIKVMISCSKTP